jgi:hypothetical protein
MTTVSIIILTLWILALGRQLHRSSLAWRWEKSRAEHLESENAWLRSRCAAPDVEVSNFADNEAAMALAIKSGYIGALIAHDIKDDVDRRADALRSSLKYYRENVAAAVAAENH